MSLILLSYQVYCTYQAVTLLSTVGFAVDTSDYFMPSLCTSIQKPSSIISIWSLCLSYWSNQILYVLRTEEIFARYAHVTRCLPRHSLYARLPETFNPRIGRKHPNQVEAVYSYFLLDQDQSTDFTTRSLQTLIGTVWNIATADLLLFLFHPTWGNGRGPT